MLVKDGERRFNRWKMKYDLVKKGQPIRQLSAESEQKLKKQYVAMAKVENEIKKILGDAGVSTILNFSYLAFAREVYGFTRRYTSKKLQTEIDFAIWKWKTRQLNEELLGKIRDKVYKMTGVDVIV
jgi:hypothetical protein